MEIGVLKQKAHSHGEGSLVNQLMPGNNCFSRWAYNGFMKYDQNIKQSYLVKRWKDFESLFTLNKYLFKQVRFSSINGVYNDVNHTNAKMKVYISININLLKGNPF